MDTPRKRPEPPRTIPAIPRPPSAQKESDPPHSDSDRSELLLRELKGVEQRAQRSLAELSAVYERELGKRDETIRELQEQSRDAASADTELSRQLADMQIKQTAIITAVVTQELSKRFPDRAESKEIAQGANRTNKVWATLIAGVVGGLVVGGATLAKSCQEPSVNVPVPTIPQAQPGIQH